MNDELARAIYVGVIDHLGWSGAADYEDRPKELHGRYEAMANAAQDYYGIPPSAKKGAVGRLIDFHKRMLTGVVDADECRDILRAMGEKVAG